MKSLQDPFSERSINPPGKGEVVYVKLSDRRERCACCGSQLWTVTGTTYVGSRLCCWVRCSVCGKANTRIDARRLYMTDPFEEGEQE